MRILVVEDEKHLNRIISEAVEDEELTEALRAAIYNKPRAHCFDTSTSITEKHAMSQIGG